MISRRTVRQAAATALLLLAATACQPGWVNPFVGTGDGSGVAPVDTVVPNGDLPLGNPAAIAAIPSGGAYVYDASRCVVYRQLAGSASRFAGSVGVCGNSGDGGLATDATINAKVTVYGLITYPMATDAAGNLYLAASGGLGLRRVDATTGTISTIALPTDSATSRYLTGLATDTDGSLLVLVSSVMQLSAGSATVYRLNPDSTLTTVTTFPVVAAAVSLAVTGGGHAVVTDTYGMERLDLYRLDLATGTYTDTGVGLCVKWTGSYSQEQSQLAALSGNVYAVDSSCNRVIRIAPDNTTTVVAGSGTADPATTRQRGQGSELQVTPTALAATPLGNVLFGSGHVLYYLFA